MLTTPQPDTAGTFDLSPRRFTDHLCDNAARFFPELDCGDLAVKVKSHSMRHQSQLLQLEVLAEESTRAVIYKIPFSVARAKTTDAESKSRPRLYPEAEQVTNGVREFTALQSIEAHFKDLDSSLFKTIAMFELLESPWVMVMEMSPDPDLKSRLKKSTRWHWTNDSVTPALESAGRWLREFHGMTPLEHTEQRHATRDEYLKEVERFCGALAGLSGDGSWFRSLATGLRKLALLHLPSEIPRAVIHGDFAPRNILVSPSDQVTIIDTQRRWLAPLYEDLAWLLIALKSSGPQARSQGLLFSGRQLRRWESAFLSSYFGSDTYPRAAVRLYECLLLLEWWAALTIRQKSGSLSQRLQLGLTNRFLRSHFCQMMNEIDEQPGVP